ncbi:hypothetical protein [Acinetobacter indicus]|nr:hypothetical protein [Acinetobacter indicus]
MKYLMILLAMGAFGLSACDTANDRDGDGDGTMLNQDRDGDGRADD